MTTNWENGAGSACAGQTPFRGRALSFFSLLCLLVSTEAALSQTVSYSPADLDSVFAKDTLVIHATENACYRFDIWLAKVRDQQMRGLMFVRDLPEFTGMLFVYDGPGRRSMWMKNTYIPLDIVFIRDDGVVSSIVADAEPLNLTSLSSIEPVPYVLELAGGVAATLGITPGDQVEWSGIQRNDSQP